jgi:hypothetical protein
MSLTMVAASDSSRNFHKLDFIHSAADSAWHHIYFTVFANSYLTLHPTR